MKKRNPSRQFSCISLAYCKSIFQYDFVFISPQTISFKYILVESFYECCNISQHGILPEPAPETETVCIIGQFCVDLRTRWVYKEF